MNPSPVTTQQQGDIWVVTLNRSEGRNAVDRTTALALHAVCLAFEDDDSAQAAVFHGAHGHFCAGWDLQAGAAGVGGPADAARLVPHAGSLQPIIQAMTAPLTDGTQVLVLQHLNEDGPGYLGQWLDEQGVRWQVLCTEAGEPYPASVQGIQGLAVLGGAWSANDDRPSLRQAEALIREADALGISVLGHCLGGQLMARAFGGRVETLAQPEIGWHAMTHNGCESARNWLGETPDAVVYQWHHDGFVELPTGAEPLASSPACAHQAFALRQHLAMQFHIEITPQKISDWMAHPGASYPDLIRQHPSTVQGAQAVADGTERHQAGSEALARQIYDTWRSRWHG